MLKRLATIEDIFPFHEIYELLELLSLGAIVFKMISIEINIQTSSLNMRGNYFATIVKLN